MTKYLFSLVLFVLPVVALADDAFNKDSKRSVRVGYELYGGYVTDLAIDDEGRMYASTLSANGIFHSTDGADSWTGPVGGTDLGKVNVLVVSDEPDTAYVVGGISLYKTTDGGDNWEELAGSGGNAVENDFNLTIAYANGVLVAPVRDGTLDISTDEGESFTSMSIADGVSTDTIVGNASGSTFYLMANAGADTRTLYVLDVAAETVTATSESGNYPWVGVKPTDTNFIVIAGADGVRYTTTGASGTWQTLTTEPITGEINFIGDRIYLGDQYTDNLGVDLTRMEVTANQLAVDPNDSNTLIIGSGVGISLSSDGGENWETQSEGLLGVTVNDIAQSDNKKRVWLAAQGGLARSNNFLSDAPTWEYPILPDAASSDIESIWIDPADADHLVAGSTNLYVSRDGGDTWQVADGALSLTGTFKDIVADGDTLYAAYFGQQGEDGTVYLSTDGGNTWSDVTGLDAPASTLGLLANGTLVVGTGYEFSDDVTKHGIFLYNGSNWDQVSTGADQSITSLVVVGETIYAVGIGDPDGKLLLSTDNGETWKDITDNGLPSDAYFHSVTAADANTLYAATGRPAGTSYVYKSTDAGDSWSLLYTGLVDEEFNAMLFDGLTTGTSIGLQSLFSKTKLTASVKGDTLTLQLQDAATKDKLKQRTLKLYKKTKKSGDWVQVKLDNKRTGRKGKITYQLDQSKTTYYQVRWVPNTVDTATYGEDVVRSSQLKVVGSY